MSYDEPFVGSLAIVMALIAAAIAAGPWEAPYQLRNIRSVNDRFGKLAARGIWAVIAIATFTAGVAIFSGTRPPYVTPAHQSMIDR